MANPMEQFAIEPIVHLDVAGTDLSFTNSSLWMLIAMLVVAAFLYIGTAKPQLVPGRAQAAVEQRRLERKIEAMTQDRASHMSEIGRRATLIRLGPAGAPALLASAGW